MSEYYLIELVRRPFGQVGHVAYFSRLHKEAILFWHIILCTIYNYVFPFFFLGPSLYTSRYLSLGHPRVFKEWSDGNSTTNFFPYLYVYAKNSKNHKIRTGDFSWTCQRPVCSLLLIILDCVGQLSYVF